MRTPTSRRNTAHRADHWLTYSGMAGAFLAVAADADAQVIYTDVDPDHVVINSDYSIDLDLDGTIDVQFLHIAGSTYAAALMNVGPGDGFIANATSSGFAYPLVLPGGDPIGPLHANWQPAASSFALLAGSSSGAVYGHWNGQSGFLGIRFLSSGVMHYGWIELEVTAQSGSIIVKGYAYDATVNASIPAGDMGDISVQQVDGPAVAFDVFPNPVRDRAVLRINGSDAGRYQVNIVNTVGQMLSTQQLELASGDNTSVLDLSALSDGIYFVQLRQGDRVVYRKITKGG